MTNCRYIKQKYNQTPNDYDLNFNYNQIPANISYEGASDIETTLNKTLPLTKTIHLNLATSNNTTTNGYRLNTRIEWRQ